MRLAFRRIAAWAIDCACVLGWVGMTAAIGVPLYRAGFVRIKNLLTLNLIGALVVVVPVVIGAAILESRASGVTPESACLAWPSGRLKEYPPHSRLHSRETL